MAANEYWLKRLKRDRALAERATEEVTKEVRKAYRGQYLTISRRLDELYAEAQRRGELSRTKLWNYRTYRDMERELRGFCEVNVQTQRGAMYSCLDHVFEEIIGASPARFRQEKYIVPYNPRAVIDTAWSGEHFSDRIWRNTEALADQIRAEAQQVVMGLKSPGRIKQDLMRAYDVSWNQAERLVDTEVSYVLNKANLENYRRMDCKKVTIVNLDVNTCEKCKALEGEVFEIEDAPVLPIHPRCHCSFCIPREGDDAEVTASGEHLEEVYTRKGVKGYEEAPQYTPANAPRTAERQVLAINQGGETTDAAHKQPSKPAIVASTAPGQITETKAAKTPENKENSVLQGKDKGSIIATSSEAEGNGVRIVGRINHQSITQQWGPITPEVVLTKERIQHIKDHHPGAYEKYEEYITETIEKPEIILIDSKNDQTAAFVRHTNDSNLNIMVKLAMQDNVKGIKSSIITMYPVSSKRLDRLLRKSKVLYNSGKT